MASSSLVVRIAADLNDFSRNLNKMTRDVDRAAKTVSDIGKTMSLAITLPVGLATVALARMGLENQAVAAKLDRVFGPAAARVNEQLTRMQKIVPVAGTELQKMAIQTNEFAAGLGLSAPKAALLSENVMKMAASMSAAKGIGMDESLDMVTHALEGATRGLKSVGIVIEQAQVKQEAYRLGLLRTGNELTPLGTALATYSLMVKQAASFQSEATAVQHDAAWQLAQLKTGLSEFADATSNLLVPTLRVLIGVGRGLVDLLSKLPDWFRGGAIAIAVFAATIGPTITLAAKLAQGITAISAAIKLLAEGEALAKFLTLLKDPKVVIATLLIAAALTAAVAAWQHFKKEVEKPIDAKALDPLAGIGDMLKGLTGATDFSTKDPLAALRTSTDELTTAFERALAVGDLLGDSVSALGAKRLDAQRMGIHGATRVDRNGGLQLFDQISKLLATNELAHLIGGGASGGVVASGARREAGAERSPQGLRFDLASSLVSDELQLMAREMALTVDTFDAPRVAALQLAERFRQTAHDFAVGVVEFKRQWTDGAGASALAGLEAGLTGVMNAMNPASLAFEAVGKVMQGLQPIIDNLMGPLVALGQIVAEIAGPVLRPLFQVLKVFGIAVAMVGEVVYTVAAGIARLVGNLIVAIGSFIRKIPFLGGIGKQIQNVGNGMLDLSKSFSNTAKQLDRDRINLQNLDFDQAANGLQTLSDSALSAAEQLTNLPPAFKINLERFRATLPIGPSPYANTPGGYTGAPSGGSGGSSGGGDSGGDNGQGGAFNKTPPTAILMDGRLVAQLVWDRVTSASKGQFGTRSRVADVVTV